jgi:hypothetical protein
MQHYHQVHFSGGGEMIAGGNKPWNLLICRQPSPQAHVRAVATAMQNRTLSQGAYNNPPVEHTPEQAPAFLYDDSISA